MAEIPSLRSADIVAVDACADTSLALTADGRVYAWGNSEYGQLFHGTAHDTIVRPALAASLQRAGRVRAIAAGGTFSAVLTGTAAVDRRRGPPRTNTGRGAPHDADDDGVYTAGFGPALGHGRAVEQSTEPRRVAHLPPIAQLYASSDSTAAITRTRRRAAALVRAR